MKIEKVPGTLQFLKENSQKKALLQQNQTTNSEQNVFG